MKKRLLAAVGGIALILSPAAAMAVDTYSAQLSGADEVPPRATDAFGTIVVSHFPGLGRARFTLDVRRATAILSAVGGRTVPSLFFSPARLRPAGSMAASRLAE